MDQLLILELPPPPWSLLRSQAYVSTEGGSVKLRKANHPGANHRLLKTFDLTWNHVKKLEGVAENEPKVDKKCKNEDDP